MTGYERLAALLEPRVAANDDRPDLYEGFEEGRETEIAPGAAILAAAGLWLAEHWPALAVGAVAGLLAVLIPALIIAPALAR